MNSLDTKILANIKVRSLLFIMFLMSGFCGLLYQVIWLRKAFSSFGVITPVISLVVSVFMLGLGLGSWLGGRLASNWKSKDRGSIINIYAICELIIGLSAFTVPALFEFGESTLLNVGQSNSSSYLILSAIALSLSILPWCIFMGMTFPLVMGFVKEIDNSDSTSFSFLYLANVIGAMCGAALTAVVLVELLGFSLTLYVGAAMNFIVAGMSFYLGSKFRKSQTKQSVSASGSIVANDGHVYGLKISPLWILFWTGFSSMAMEVVWVRAFTPVIKTTIYAFALLLTVYLFATWIGSYLYRSHLKKGNVRSSLSLITIAAVSSLLPIVLNDPRFHPSRIWVLMTIFPICSVLGYLTPYLIDQFSKGEPQKAGSAYAINILGSIIGPLLAGYVLLPYLGVKSSLLILAAPLILLFIFEYKSVLLSKFAVIGGIFTAILLATSFTIKTYEDSTFYENSAIKRDHTATVIAEGTGMKKRLLVNGVGITHLTPITKIMAHMPLAYLSKTPESALVICFGMGTTFRSLMSWDILVRAAELVPSVVDMFPFFFQDADQLLKNDKGKVIVDDGRRYLKRTDLTFDVITIDPPPPVEAAGSSLLYSKDFYSLIRERLSPDGILQQWYPGGEKKILQAIARALNDSFEHVRVYQSIEGWGYHFLASDRPVINISQEQFLSRLPQQAKLDLMEWYPERTIEEVTQSILNKELDINSVLGENENIIITDDKPFNEYFFLRRQWDYANKKFQYAE